jgi:hypothetical protein
MPSLIIPLGRGISKGWNARVFPSFDVSGMIIASLSVEPLN